MKQKITAKDILEKLESKFGARYLLHLLLSYLDTNSLIDLLQEFVDIYYTDEFTIVSNWEEL